jgi:hypothetical protein
MKDHTDSLKHLSMHSDIGVFKNLETAIEMGGLPIGSIKL